MAGLEPAPHSRTLSCRCSTTLNYTTNHLFLYIALYLRPSRARKPLLAFALQHYPSPQHGLTHYWCLLSGLRLIVLLNTPLLPWLIRPTSTFPLFPRPYTTTFLPYCLRVGTISWPSQGSELTATRFRLYLRIGYRLFPLHPLSWSLSMPFRANHSRCCHSDDITHHENIFCLLTGIARCTSLGVCGR